jgi:hypothetical protein
VITIGDRKHWQADLGRFSLERWCPGAPCHLPGVRVRHHWIRVRIYRRTGAARFDD